MLADLVKLGEPVIAHVDVTDDEGKPVAGSPRRWIALVKAKFLECGCEHQVQSDLDLAAIQRRLHGSRVSDGRVKQLLLAETRRVCRESGCPTHGSSVRLKQ